MQPIPSDILTQYSSVLEKRAVPVSSRGDYLEKTGAPDWDRAIEELDAEIKTRHYSRKTLKTYADWCRKFQRFLNNKPTASLTSDDVKAYLTHLA